MKTRMLMAMGLVALLAATAGYGLQGEGWALKTKVDFDFTVGNKVLPAGEYTFEREAAGEAFRITGAGKIAALAPVVTRLAADIHTTPQDGHLIFDVIGGKSVLAEIWIPGEDGYVLAVTKGKHEHKVINIQK